MQRKAKIVLESRFKKDNHLGNLDDIGGEKIRAPDLNVVRGSIAGNKGFFIKGLNPTKTHSVSIFHGGLRIFRTTREPNFTNLSLSFARQGWKIPLRGSIDHDGKTTGSTAGLSWLRLLSRPSPYTQTKRTIGPRGSMNDWENIREVERVIKRQNPSQKGEEEETDNDHQGPTKSKTRKGKQGKKKKDIPK